MVGGPGFLPSQPLSRDLGRSRSLFACRYFRVQGKICAQQAGRSNQGQCWPQELSILQLFPASSTSPVLQRRSKIPMVRPPLIKKITTGRRRDPFKSLIFGLQIDDIIALQCKIYIIPTESTMSACGPLEVISYYMWHGARRGS